MLRAGMTVETPNGWLMEITEIRWWSDDDGEVFGRQFAVRKRMARWSKEKYLGTVRGIEQARIKRV